jgi:hypothetical protein
LTLSSSYPLALLLPAAGAPPAPGRFVLSMVLTVGSLVLLLTSCFSSLNAATIRGQQSPHPRPHT